MSQDERTRYPQTCTHCGKSINHLRPVGEHLLNAAIAVLNGARTSREVAAAMETSTKLASMHLKAACEAGLVRIASREKVHSAGGSRILYEPSQRIAAFAWSAWRLYERDHYQKPA